MFIVHGYKLNEFTKFKDILKAPRENKPKEIELDCGAKDFGNMLKVLYAS
jgi:hypothetical protein